MSRSKHFLRFLACLATAFLSLHFLPLTYAVPTAMTPLLILCYRGLELSSVHALSLCIVWTLYDCFLLLPCFLFLGKYAFIGIYFPFAIILKHIRYQPSQLFLWTQTIVWDTPLLIWIRMLALFNVRALGPFYSEINEYLIIGSMPLPKDVILLHRLNCGAVVNMCREYAGPLAEYQRWGIVQHRAPTADLCQPTLRDIIEGCEFMHDFRRSHPSQRIFVHCKGGRARAATMGLCFLLREEGCSATDLTSMLNTMIRKRNVITPAILQYPVIHEYIKHLGTVQDEMAAQR